MSLSDLKKISRESVASQVYEHIKMSIIDGVLPPGTHLIEKTIAETMGTSRGPVREALRQLEADGLVESKINVGTFVRSFSVGEIEELYTARIVLEAYIAHLAAEKMTQDRVPELQGALTATIEAARRGDFHETIEADFGFHRTIWEIADHGIINDMLGRLEVRIRMFISLQASLFESLYTSIQDHNLIFEAIVGGHSELAEGLMHTHIQNAGLLVVEKMKKDAGAA
jgi:DNA-binding GntR family transcriptional regulator